jgi:hypothetical protein
MEFVSVSMIESIAADAYAEFYDSHKDLFKNNIHEYWFLASLFKDAKVRDEVYTRRYALDKDYDPIENIYT